MSAVNILVVDDEQIVLDSIRKHLRSEQDYHVTAVQHVDEALKILQKENIDIVLTDLMMPEIDGLEFLAMLNEKSPDTLSIMITGYATIKTALQATQLGAFDYLAKPFTRDELKKMVRRAADLVYAGRSSSSSAKNVKSAHSEQKKAAGKMKGIGEHSWFVRQEDGSVLIGVERPFLYSIGKIQTVYLPAKGDELRQGSVYFQIFSADLRSQSLLSPLSGSVIEVNPLVEENPQKALEEPYGSGWLIRLDPSNFDGEVKIMGL